MGLLYNFFKMRPASIVVTSSVSFAVDFELFNLLAIPRTDPLLLLQKEVALNWSKFRTYVFHCFNREDHYLTSHFYYMIFSYSSDKRSVSN